MAVEALGRTFGVKLTDEYAPTVDTKEEPKSLSDAELVFSDLKYFGSLELVASDENLFISSARCISLLNSYGGKQPRLSCVTVERGLLALTLGSEQLVWQAQDVLQCSYHPDGWLVLVHRASASMCHAYLFSMHPVLKVCHWNILDD